MRSSSFSLFILSLLSLNSFFVVDSKPTINHNHQSETSTFGFSKERAQSFYRDFGLSPVLDANVLSHDPLASAQKIVEKPIHFPASISDYEIDNSARPPIARDLGHYAGYYKLANTKGAKMFYYFFKSTKNDRNAPVVVWLTGGPGCSSSLGLFYLNGPFKLTKKLTLVQNKYSWSEESNIIYIDQPTATGFSYTTDKADIRHTSEEAGLDFYNFMQAFFEKHPEYQRNDFYITGESYAGHYIPAFATQIQKGNKNSKNTRINLKGIGIGNGWTNPGLQTKSLPDYALKMKLINQTHYNNLQKPVRECQKETHIACDGTNYDLAACAKANRDCVILEDILNSTDRVNYYDIRKKCAKGQKCYNFSGVETFLNQKSVKKALSVSEDIHFISCSKKAYAAMQGDWMRNLGVYVPRLLKDGIKVLIYAGEYDLICNWIGNLMWVEHLKWSGQRSFLSSRKLRFKVDSANAGWYKSYGNLTFLNVKNAGHLVPMDQPKASLEMLRRWIKDIPL